MFAIDRAVETYHEGQEGVGIAPIAVRRRRFMMATGAGIALCLAGGATGFGEEPSKMYGLIGKMTSILGQRDALIGILVARSSARLLTLRSAVSLRDFGCTLTDERAHLVRAGPSRCSFAAVRSVSAWLSHSSVGRKKESVTMMLR